MDNLKTLYCTPEQVLKDAEFCNIVDELLQNPEVSILILPKLASVRCKRRYNLFKRMPSHIGYESHHVEFVYREHTFSVRNISPNPFQDRKPGSFYFLPTFNVRDWMHVEKVPNSYYIKYKNLKSIDDWYAYNEKRKIA